MLFVLALALAVAPSCGRRKRSGPRAPVAVVQDFERDITLKRWPPDAAGVLSISGAWSADGKRSLEIGPGVMAAFSDLRLDDWSGYAALRFTVHNPSPLTAAIGLEIQDEHEAFADRHQHSFGAPPGDHVITLDFSGGLWRGEENRPYRGKVKTPISTARISRLAFTNEGSAAIFVDRIEVVMVPPLATPGGFAFDFGKSGKQVMGQTIGIFESTTYDPARGYGLLGPIGDPVRSLSYPTPLLGDGLPLGRGFRVDLPGGPHLGWIAFERGGFSEGDQCAYDHADLLVNGTAVTGHDFGRSAPHFRFEDTEVTDPAQIEEALVRPAHAPTRFRFEARRGENVFSLAVQNEGRNPLRVAGIILAPDTPEGAAFLDAHEQRHHDAIAIAYPPQDRGRREPPRHAPTRDLVAEPLALGAQLHPRDFPEHPEGADPPTIFAIPGQVAAMQMALYSIRPLHVHAQATPMLGPGGATLPMPAISHGRYLPMRPLGNGPVWIEINHYRPEPDFSVEPSVARALLVEVRVPAQAVPGLYEGAVNVTDGTLALRIPIRMEVAPVVLPPIPIPVGLFMNALPFGPDVVGEERYWALSTALLDEQARAGLSCVTGGAGLDFHVRRVGDEVTVEGDRALRYLALARERGPVLAIVNYGGFFPELHFDDAGAAVFARAFSAFASARDLPPFYFASYDEPSTEAELAQALAQVGPLSRAGLRTMGFLTRRKRSPLVDRVIDATFAPAMNGHDGGDVRALAARGKHPWAYNNGLDRYGMGLHLWRSIRAGVEGRLEWIGLITQGFAFDNLDGREPANGAWLVHDRLGLMPTPRWLSAREGLIDLRIRLLLDKVIPEPDPVLATWPIEGYGKDRDRWTDAALTAARNGMLERLIRAAPTKMGVP
ncbi:Hypothetical protein A7982_07584 [Minicystis rosea]|nr:Hypothetical protein A7982_07584 [Minicystis rosea]